jgi:hypothetical protein
MRFRCAVCGTPQWRGLFPHSNHYIRWAVIHGVALGTCGAATKILFTQLGYGTDGWRNGLASLGVCAIFLLGLYGFALIAEALLVTRRRCRACGMRGLQPDPGGKERTPTMKDIVVGGLYATRDQDGTYRIVKVLVVDEFAVHLRMYANRFQTLPTQVSSSQLSLGGLDRLEGIGIGHFPLAREGFLREQRILVGREPVADEELEGYRIWAGIESVDE